MRRAELSEGTAPGAISTHSSTRRCSCEIHRRYVLNVARLARIGWGLTEAGIAVLNDGLSWRLAEPDTRGEGAFVERMQIMRRESRSMPARRPSPAVPVSSFVLHVAKATETKKRANSGSFQTPCYWLISSCWTVLMPVLR